MKTYTTKSSTLIGNAAFLEAIKSHEAICYLKQNKEHILQEVELVLANEMFRLEYVDGAILIANSDESPLFIIRALFDQEAWADKPELFFAYFMACSTISKLTRKTTTMVDYIASELWKQFFINESQLEAQLAYEKLPSLDRVAVELEGHKPTFKIYSKTFISLKGFEKLKCYISLDDTLKCLGYPDLRCSLNSSVIQYNSVLLEIDGTYEHFKSVDSPENDFIKVNDAQVRVSRLPMHGGDCMNTFRWVSAMPINVADAL